MTYQQPSVNGFDAPRRGESVYALRHWQNLVSHQFITLECTSQLDASFYGNVCSYQLGALQLARVESRRQTVQRPVNRQTRYQDDGFYLCLQLEGLGSHAQLGKEAHLNRGDFVLHNVQHPYSMQFPADFAQLVVHFPRELLREQIVDVNRFAGVRLQGSEGTGRLFSNMVQQLLIMYDSGDRISADVISTLVKLLGTVLTEVGSGGAPHSDAKESLRCRLIHYIDRHLSDPDFTCEQLAIDQSLSSRYVRAVFADVGDSPSAWILRRRLENAQLDLLNPRLAGRSITAVAYRWGFRDGAGFSRAYKAMYGQSPRDAKATALERNLKTQTSRSRSLC